jgi:L-threonylcarbamoyladenylate synthase
MKILPANTGLMQALEALERGGVVAHATETCYGLACDLTNPEAVKKLFKIKNRPTDLPVSALFGSIFQAKKYAHWGKKSEKMAQLYLPGPLTLVLDMLSGAPEKLYPTPGGGKTIGVRISSHSVANQLALYYTKPISTTSANFHGQENPYSPKDIKKQYKDRALKPDLILDSGKIPKVPPSTVIDLTKEKEEVLRLGEKKIG